MLVAEDDKPEAHLAPDQLFSNIVTQERVLAIVLHLQIVLPTSVGHVCIGSRRTGERSEVVRRGHLASVTLLVVTIPVALPAVWAQARKEDTLLSGSSCVEHCLYRAAPDSPGPNR